jgi:hypothetical protein
MIPKRIFVPLVAAGLLAFPGSAFGTHPVVQKAGGLKLSMVPAYNECTTTSVPAASVVHRNPVGGLAGLSSGAPEGCTPPTLASPLRFAIKSGKVSGSASTQIKVKAGDVETQFKASGVDDPTGAFGPAGPYTGPGGVGIAGVRITDHDCADDAVPASRDSGPFDTDCTLRDIPFPINPPADACQAGKCKVKVTVNQQIANAVRAGAQAVVGIGYEADGLVKADGPVQIRDENGNTALVSGIFIP